MTVSWKDIQNACKRMVTLGAAGALAGTELVTVERNGVRLKTTVGALGGGGGGGSVDSVNGEIGTVVLDADDIAASATRLWLTSAERTKLTGVESGATADQSGAEIKALYEAQADTNAFTDAQVSKLAGIEAAADVTDAANVASAGAFMASSAGTFATKNGLTVYHRDHFTVNGTLATGVAAARLTFARAATITNIRASVSTAPTGASIIVDVLKNGTTIFTGGTGRPTIAATTNADNTATPAVTSMAADDYLQVEIVQVGSTVAGATLVVTVEYTENLT